MTKTGARAGSGRKRNGRSASARTQGDEMPFEAVMQAAERSGLLKDKTGRIAGRVSPTLVAKAKKRTGIKSDSDLIAFALANLALEDQFVETFRRSRGTVDPGLNLDF
jgi:hypothetical protein